MTRISIRERIALAILGKEKVADSDILPSDLQMRVVTETALEAAIDLAFIQNNLIHAVFTELAELGIFIGVDKGISDEIEKRMSILRASHTVAGEISGELQPIKGHEND